MTARSAGQSKARRMVASLYEQHLDELHRYLLRIGVSPSQAKDSCQEAFVRLFLALRANQRIKNPRAWLFAVAHNTALDSLKRSQRQEPFEQSRETSIAAPTPDPEQTAMEQEQAARLRRAVENLPPKERHCVHLRSEGLRYRQIAEVLGISITSVAESIERAVRQIREAFHE